MPVNAASLTIGFPREGGAERRTILTPAHDLALGGGGDDPLQMIALCPNCHATKTRGTKRDELKPILLAEAKKRHERLAEPAQKP